jgi:hypothetical protein
MKISTTKIYRTNIILAISVGVLVVAYIFVSNFILSQSYRFDVLKRHLDQSSALLDSASAHGDDGQNLEQISLFAQRNGMVEAKDTYSLFKDSSVAVSSNGQ